MWAAIQARHPEQAAALPESPAVITVQRSGRRASARPSVAATAHSAAATTSEQTPLYLPQAQAPGLLDLLLTALQHSRQMQPDATSMSLPGVPFQQQAEAANRLAAVSPQGLGLFAPSSVGPPIDQPAGPEMLSSAQSPAMSPMRSQSSVSRLTAESILAATQEAQSRTSPMRRQLYSRPSNVQ